MHEGGAGGESTSEGRCTVYAKPFPKSATEERVRELFVSFGRVRRVKLRRDGFDTFRGSVYIVFEDEEAAARACRHPPVQVNGSTERLQVLLKAEYEKLRNGGAGSSAQHSLSQGHKRAKHEHAGTPVPAQDTTAGLVEELRKEKEEVQRLQKRLAEAQQRAEEAVAREQAASQKLLARDIEVGSLKGEVQVLRVQAQVQAERVHTQYKSRVADLEAQLQKAKDQHLERQRLERESSRRGAATAARTPPLGELDDDGL